ncbi:hypothetical protein [Pseudomonas aeruginosa]|uniref:hypothetical protein n=1 Tax=Pseudomonas aeruginosa TaxID=287 RepID=UPI000B119E18
MADAFASYDTRFGGHGVKFQLNVKNLFDRTYYPKGRRDAARPCSIRFLLPPGKGLPGA